ncbi:MAG: c-type cytochrome [Ilumatobacter fluminis]|uniref:c-type cytochrome n=1 Tax=Ilumatobacter fluminis TaxID=467091 RepID=UPI0032EE4216
MRTVRLFGAFVLAAVVLGVSACGADGEGAAGIYRTNGCSACHGADLGGGALGPALTWSEGDTVELADGSTATIDADYVERAIVDPSAEIVAGWDDTMPVASLSASEVDLLVDYLLAGP